MILSYARTRTRHYVDDDDAVRFVDQEVNDELASAQHGLWRMVGDRSSLWTSETTALSSDATGKVDLTSIKPLRLVSVAITASGISRWLIRPARLADGWTNVPTIQTLRIAYVPRPSFPSADANPFVWGPGGSGAGFDTEMLDRVLCLRAAAALRVKVGTPNPVLQAELDRAQAEVLALMNIPRFTQIPLEPATRKQRAPWYYVMTSPDTMQLVV